MTLRLLPYTPARDAYRLLGVPPSASTDEIGAACRRLARTFHPDHNRSLRATQEMQVVNAVRQVLTDPTWRATYDRERLRFQSRPSRPSAPARVTFAAAPALRLEQRPASALARYGRAVRAGLGAAIEALMPGRCGRCRTVVASGDAYCAACGSRLARRVMRRAG